MLRRLLLTGLLMAANGPKWKFDPAIKGLQFVEATVKVPIEFKPPSKK